MIKTRTVDAAARRPKQSSRCRAEAALRESEERYRGVVENTTAIILRVGLDGIIRFANGRALEFFGYSADELIGKHAVGTIIPERETTGRDLAAMVGQIAENPDRFHSNANENMRKNGERVWLEWTNSGIYDAGGKLAEFLAVGIDATERKKAELAVSESDSRYRAYFNLPTAGIAVTSPGKAWIDANPALCDMLGYTREELLCRTWADLTHPEDLERDINQFRRVMGGETDGYSLEKRFIRKNRTVIWVDLSVHCVRSGSGEVNYFIALLKDITDRKRAQRELEDSEHRYRQLVQSSPDAVIVHRQGTILYANAAAVSMYGAQSRAQLKERNILDLIHPDDRDETLERMRQLEKGGKIPLKEMRVVRLDGQELLVEAYASRVTYGEGRAVQVIIRDITERRRTEKLKQAIADVDEVIHSTLSSSEVMNSALNKAREAIGCETAAISLREGNRWRISHVLGLQESSIGTYLGDEDEPHALLAIQTKKAVAINDAFNDTRTNCEHMRRWSIRSVLVVPLIVKDDPIGVLFMNYHSKTVTFAPAELDFAERFSASLSLALENARLFENLIRSRDELEQRVLERTRELATRADQLRALAGELTMAEQRERRRLANVLHDHLQQLLVGAKFGLTAAGKGGDDAQKHALKEVEEVIDEAIASSRSLTAELSPPILHDEGLRAGLEWLARRLSRMQGFHVELESEEIGVLPDDLTILLFQSVRELLLNAAKHSQARSARIEARRMNGALQVTVSDQGIGFDSESMPAPGEPGRGFGLFSIRERLELFGGAMNIESAPGQGSRITLSVPVTVAIPGSLRSTEAASLPESFERRKVPAPIEGRKIRVLLADDHAVVRQGIANLLGDEPDMEIVGAAANGREALVLTSKLLPEVILMDMNMPILNGVETTRLIHRDFPEIRVIGLSMFEEVEKAQAMRDAGAVNYLTKTGPAEELMRAIRTAVGRFPKGFAAITS